MKEKIDIVEERVRASELFDYYGELLKENQKQLCSQYLLDDLSLSEIAEGIGISRQGVHDSLRRSIKQMESFESKLNLIKKSKMLEEELECLKRRFQTLKKTKEIEDIQESIQKIFELV